MSPGLWETQTSRELSSFRHKTLLTEFFQVSHGIINYRYISHFLNSINSPEFLNKQYLSSILPTAHAEIYHNHTLMFPRNIKLSIRSLETLNYRLDIRILWKVHEKCR